jgi:uncharacterized protein YjiS (DUF1127 family)
MISSLATQNPYVLINRIHRPQPDIDRKRNTMIAHIVRFIREWKRYNQNLSELNRLGDRELADIGISRSDIARVAWNSSHQG